MIDKLIRIHNVGLYENGTAGKPIQFGKVTLIYGGNGRGKSTLACLLRSWATGNTTDVSSKKCLDAASEPSVGLIWKGQNVQNVKFENGQWSSENGDVVVFDTQFIDDNVYSGFEVAPRQRQRLLEFAIGLHSVAIKREIDECDAKSDPISRAMRANEAVLKVASGPMKLQQYFKATVPDDIDAQIEAANLHLSSLKDVANIRARNAFVKLQISPFSLNILFEAFRKTLPNVEEEAEAKIKQHLAQLGNPGAETWLKSGLSMIVDDRCPFCNSALEGLSLVATYRSFFNESYARHKEIVDKLVPGIEAKFGETALPNLCAQEDRNTLVAQSWATQLPVDLPKINRTCAKTALNNLNILLSSIARAKQLSPLSEFGTEAEESEAVALLNIIGNVIAPYNKAIDDAQAKVTAYLSTLSTGSIPEATAKLEHLQAIKRLRDPDIIAAKAGYIEAKTEHEKITSRKAELRKQLNEEMPALLAKYADRINQRLHMFGAQFKIVDLKSTHQGGLPSSDWAIELRGKRIGIAASPMSTGKPSFRNALSDGDKRALAFAFFVARLADDPATDSRVLVIDDPVSSLDRFRTRETQRLLVKLARMCKQLIVLSHDAHCIQNLELGLRELGKPDFYPVVLAIDRVENDYSVIVERSLEEETGSDYSRNYRFVKTFIDRPAQVNLLAVGRSIRPLLEGYLRRKFIGVVDRSDQLYQIVQKIKSSRPESPLYAMRRHADEIEAINNDVREFHHDGGESSSSITVDEIQVLTVARRAFAIIHAA